ncbi:hypothetical protein JNUCC0626_50175 (plasmid) [Lentzea sp. JNUCC 0626]
MTTVAERPKLNGHSLDNFPVPAQGSPGTQVSPVTHGNQGAPGAPEAQETPGNLSGETKVVQKLRAQLAERTAIRGIQDDPNWTEADTPKVIQERSKSAEAAKLHNQFRDPARRALSTSRWRKGITFAAGSGLVLSLMVSTANVQGTVAAGAPPFSGRWWFAWSVEPAIAILMLSLFAFRAFMASRGEHVDDRWILGTEVALLGTTFMLNSWNHLPYVAEKFDVVSLVSHGVWPLLAVLIVTCLPRIWAYFGDLDHGGAVADEDLVEKSAVVRQWIADRVLPPTPSRIAIEKTFREHDIKISTRTAQRVYRCLTGRTELL